MEASIETTLKSSLDLLPPLNLEEVRAKLVRLLSDAAELSAYIEAVRDDGTVVVKDFSQPPVNASCVPIPLPTRVGEAVGQTRLEKSIGALRTANEDFGSGQALRIVLSALRPACVARETGEPE